MQRYKKNHKTRPFVIKIRKNGNLKFLFVAFGENWWVLVLIVAGGDPIT